MHDGRQITAEHGGKVTVSPDSRGVAVTVNCRRDGVPAHVVLNLEEAADLHSHLEALILQGAGT